MKSALIIIDMQNGFLDEYADSSTIPSACEVINYVSELMRDAGQTIIHVRDVEDADEMSEHDLAITDQIVVKPDDQHIEKVYSNAFFGTSLRSLLEERGVEFVILCGQAAEHCVVFTYNGAIEQGLTPTVLQEGVLSANVGRVEALMQDRNVISHAVVSALTG